MTEEETLKKNAEKSKVLSQLGDVIKYLEEIDKEIQRRVVIASKLNSIFKVLLVTYAILSVATFFTDDVIVNVLSVISFFAFLISILFALVAIGGVREKMQEVVGVAKTLYILGLVDEDIDSSLGKKKRQKKVLAEIAKMWEKEKKQQQEAVYGTA